MEGKKLIDAQVFNGQQKLLKVYLQTFFLWIFESFVPFRTFINKSIHCSTRFCHENDSQFDRKKELKAMREERE